MKKLQHAHGALWRRMIAYLLVAVFAASAVAEDKPKRESGRGDSAKGAKHDQIANGGKGDLGKYVDPPPVGTYPSPPETIQPWIDSLDNAKIRAHAWDVWASITSHSGEGDLPVWETWYSGHEIFDLAPTQERGERKALRDFEHPAQSIHTSLRTQIPIDQPERLTSFNRYTRSLAFYIWDHKYNEQETLINVNDAFDQAGTVVIDRKILPSKGPVDASQIVLKPVFQFISGDEPAAVPFWRGIAPEYTTNLSNPEPHTWRQGVVVDPTGKLPAGSKVRMPVNEERQKFLPVVSLDDFYHIKLTQADADAFLGSFGFGSGDDVGQANLTTKQALKKVVKKGNIALLMAMHVTTKEISNWTWQTFWWSYDTQDPLFGRDRPDSVKGPWAHYNMRTAYYMVSPPATKGGEPLISFNPYLETNLRGTVPGPTIRDADGKKQKTTIAWTGVHTNCMSCHRMAGYNTQGYQPDGLILPANKALFGKGTKTDFLWSIPIRAKPAAQNTDR